MKTRLLVILLLAVPPLAGCGQDDTAPRAAPSVHAEKSPAPTNRVDIPPTVRSNLGITFAKVQRRDVESTIRVPGAFELMPRARREYRMTLPGHVELAVEQYQRVAAGDLLYRFRSPDWPELQHEIIEGEQQIATAEAELGVARTRQEEATANLDRIRRRLEALAAAELNRADLVSEAAALESGQARMAAEFRLAETRLANAHATLKHALHRAAAATGLAESDLIGPGDSGGDRAAPAYAMIDWIEVRAAGPGVVESLPVTEGAFVEVPSVVVSTVDPTQLRFRAVALQSDLPRLARGTRGARIVPPLSPGSEIGDAIPATMAIGLEADPEHRTIELLATPGELPAWVRPGVSAFLEVVTESTGGAALAIPRSAIVKDGITHVFFRRDPKDPNKAIRVEADMGVGDGRWVAINSGLTLGDEVVLEGAYELKLATSLGGASQKGGHFHADGTFHEEAD